MKYGSRVSSFCVPNSFFLVLYIAEKINEISHRFFRAWTAGLPVPFNWPARTFMGSVRPGILVPYAPVAAATATSNTSNKQQLLPLPLATLVAAAAVGQLQKQWVASSGWRLGWVPRRLFYASSGSLVLALVLWLRL